MTEQPAAPTGPVGALGAIAKATLREVFVVPIRDGRVRTTGWSRGLAVSAVVALLAYLATMVAVLASRFLKDVGTIGAGNVSIGIFGGLTLLAMLPVLLNLAYLAALQLRWFLRLPLQLAVFAVAALPSLMVLLAVFPFARGWLRLVLLTFPVSLVLLLVGAFALIGRRLRVWIAVVSQVAMFWCQLPPILLTLLLFPGDNPLFGTAVGLTSALFFVLATLAVPSSYAAGASFVQISVNTATWTLSEIRRWVRPGIWSLLAALLLVGNLVVLAAEGWSAEDYLKAALWTAASLIAARVWLLRARRFGPWDVPRPTTMVEHLMNASGVLGLAMSSWLVLVLLPLPGHVRNVLGMSIAAVVAVVLAERAARRGQTAAAAVLAPAAVSLAGMALMFALQVTGTPHRHIAGLLSLVLIGLAVRWRGRGRLTDQQWFLLAVGGGILLIYPERELLAEPLAVLLGFSALGVLLAGLIWRLFTEGDWANEAGRLFNRDSRVLLFCAYGVVTGCAALLMAYSPDFAWDLDRFASIGSQILGVGVGAGIVVGLAEMGRFGLDPDPVPERVEPGAGVPAMTGVGQSVVGAAEQPTQ